MTPCFFDHLHSYQRWKLLSLVPSVPRTCHPPHPPCRCHRVHSFLAPIRLLRYASGLSLPQAPPSCGQSLRLLPSSSAIHLYRILYLIRSGIRRRPIFILIHLVSSLGSVISLVPSKPPENSVLNGMLSIVFCCSV